MKRFPGQSFLFLLLIVVCTINAAGGKGCAKTTTFDQETRGHGGFGIVGKDLYVSLRTPINRLKGSNMEWSGKSFEHVEIVLTDGTKILDHSSVTDCSSLCILIFCPTEIHFINYRTGYAGKYKRQSEFFPEPKENNAL